MDVHCSTCDEPWDVFHLWEDAIFETDLSVEEARVWLSLPRTKRLTMRYRKKFRAAGWEFGSTITNIVRCPCCPADATADPETVAIKAALEDLLGDDEDALAVTFEDHHL
jgi:hypothetical protein